MERRIRYEVLRTEEEEDVEETRPLDPEPVELSAAMETTPPPPIAGAAQATSAAWTDNEMTMGKQPPVPPSYEMATSLPSYEEAEQTKQEEMERLQQEEANAPVPPVWRGLGHIGDMQLGTDGMFLCMFIIAFLFNWVGLMVSVCMTHTIAGRFGAIAGFGLSMVKWVAIVKHNNWGSGLAEGDSWVWWLLIILGFLIFFRGCTQYLRIKYQWAKLNTELRARMMFMF